MAKIPATPKTAITSAPITQKVMNVITNLEMEDFDLSHRGGVMKVKGYSHKHRKHIQFIGYEANGLKKIELSECDGMTIDQRIFESKRLSAEGYTQQQIANILGVSQTTIGRDLTK